MYMRKGWEANTYYIWPLLLLLCLDYRLVKIPGQHVSARVLFGHFGQLFTSLGHELQSRQNFFSKMLRVQSQAKLTHRRCRCRSSSSRYCCVRRPRSPGPTARLRIGERTFLCTLASAAEQLGHCLVRLKLCALLFSNGN